MPVYYNLGLRSSSGISGKEDLSTKEDPTSAAFSFKVLVKAIHMLKLKDSNAPKKHQVKQVV